MKLHAKFEKFCDGLYEIYFLQYSDGDFFKMIFDILLRENQNSLMARYNDKDYSERPSYVYRMSKQCRNNVETKYNQSPLKDHSKKTQRRINVEK